MTALNPKTNWLVGYQCFLAVAFVLVFFTNMDNYLEVAISAPPYVIWLMLFMAATMPLLGDLPSRLRYLSQPVLIWVAAYLAISAASLLLASAPDTAIEEIKIRFLAIVSIVVGMLIFSQHEFVQTWARRAILVVTPINIMANIYGLIDPAFFVTIVESQSVLATGRPAGFYVDSNRAGCAIVLGLIFGLGLLPPKYRLPVTLVSFIGIFVTFSRSAPLIFLIVLAIWLIRQEIAAKKLLFWLTLFGVGLAMVIAMSGGDLTQLEQSGHLNQNTLERLTQFQNPLAVKDLDESAIGRVKIVELSWEKISASPLVGWGTGYGLTLANMYPEYGNIKSHNMYIALMLEHGLLGVMIFPALLFAAIDKASGRNQTISFAFSALVLIWGFFSHNVLEHREFLLTFSLMAAMNTTAQQLAPAQVDQHTRQLLPKPDY
jgi:O-antigen ligase